MTGNQIESCQKCLLVTIYEWYKKASRAHLIKKRLTRCVKNKCVWPHWGFLRKISPYDSVSTQHGPFRPCCFLEKKVIDKFQENVRTEGPKLVEFFCQDRRIQKYTEKNKDMDRKGFKIRWWAISNNVQRRPLPGTFISNWGYGCGWNVNTNIKFNVFTSSLEYSAS